MRPTIIVATSGGDTMVRLSRRRVPRHADCTIHGPLSPDDLLSMTFTSVKFVPGYDPDEVDDFLDFIAASMAGYTPPIAAIQVREHTFTNASVRGGFNHEEVDDFLECVARTLEGTAGTLTYVWVQE